ncbi:MAG: 30S ribosomal protein S13 [Candidatus Aenigmatarchaeota archaeon]
MTERKNILRLFETDIPGELEIINGLRRIKGIGFTASKAVLEETEIDPHKPAGEISDEEVNSLKDIIKNGGIPDYLLNRKKDPETGKDSMLVASKLEIEKRQDIDRMKKLGSYRGIRHRHGLPVRGQKTQSSFRGESSVGVATEEIKEERSEGE